MIFSPKLAHLIVAQKKTMTRRPVKEGETECRYKPGRTYAIQRGRGQKEVARLRVLEVRRELLHDLPPLDALAEGFKSRDEFFAYWRGLHKTGPLMQIPVWVIVFELVDDEEMRLLKDSPFGGYTSEPEHALLAGEGHTDVELGAEPEPEGVDEATLAGFARESGQDRVARHARFEQRVKERALEDRLAEARALAKEQGTDISRLEARIASGIEAMERKVHQDRAA